MNMPNNNPLPEILTRGVAEVLPDADGLAAKMASGPIRVFLGIDPTGSLLTLGHSVVLRKLQQFAQAGHEVILLIGNGTVKIGDPTGKDETRPVLTDQAIEENFKTWKEQASKILDFDKITIKYNGDWLEKLNYSDFIKLMAKTTVQQLLERDMFQERLKSGKPIHTHELIYPLLQGYDSVAMDVDLEIGGTDQMFNMMMGRTLQKAFNNKDKWVLTTPIINGTDGRKMSKSLNNYIALTENPIDMYGKLMRIDDAMIVEYFELLTDLSREEIDLVAQGIENGQNPMTFKKQLAYTITKAYHSEADATSAQEHFQNTVQQNQIPDQVVEVTVDEGMHPLLTILSQAMPEESNSQLRRLIAQGAVELLPEAQKPTDPFQEIDVSRVTTIKVGKRNYFKIKVATK
jgi:tyrosyl-tRNA synthetase